VTTDTPVLSVVVTLTEGGAAWERCLTALLSQDVDGEIEVIVPRDSTAPEIPVWALGDHRIRVVDLGTVETEATPASPGGQHELYDRRRAKGLAAAQGPIVAMIEDRVLPETDWARMMLELHAEMPHAVIGGPVLPPVGPALGEALHLCDYGRYTPPIIEGARDYITDVNLAYKRGPLFDTQALWQERYHETTVHWAMQSAGETLFLSSVPAVRYQRESLSLRTVLAERWAWGRLFAATRCGQLSVLGRAARAAIGPLLAPVLFLRIARRTARPPIHQLIRLTPLLLALLLAWSLGESAGYLRGTHA